MSQQTKKSKTKTKTKRETNLVKDETFINDKAWAADKTYLGPFRVLSVINLANGAIQGCIISSVSMDQDAVVE